MAPSAGPKPTPGPSLRRGILNGLRFVLVEDHRDTRELYASALRRHGAAVTEASSAQTGLLFVEREKPDLVVVDLELPDVDGYTLLDAIRRLPPDGGGRTPAVALTARHLSSDRAESLRRGFRLHLVKPVDPDELARILGGLARLGRP